MRVCILTCVAIVTTIWTCEAFELGEIDIHGFLSQGYLQSNNNNFYADTEEGTFQFNEFGINFSSDLTDKLRVGLQFLSRDLGNFNNNTVELDWAYGSYRWQDWLQIEAGLLKIAWGFYNSTRDVDMLRTPIFLPSSLYSERDRDIYSSMVGVSLGGNVYASSLGGFSYSFAYGEEDVSPDSGFLTGIGLSGDFETTNCNVTDIFSGNFEWATPLDGLRVGANLGRYDWSWAGKFLLPLDDGLSVWLPVEQSIDNAQYLIVSFEYTWNDLVLATEYHTVNETEGDDHYEPPEEAQYEGGPSEGFYGSATYRFTEHFELGAYYSVSYPNKNDRDGKGVEEFGYPDYYAWQKELVITTRFDFNEYWLLKLEGHFVNGVANFIDRDNPQGVKEDSFLFAAKTTFHF